MTTTMIRPFRRSVTGYDEAGRAVSMHRTKSLDYGMMLSDRLKLDDNIRKLFASGDRRSRRHRALTARLSGSESAGSSSVAAPVFGAV